MKELILRLSNEINSHLESSSEEIYANNQIKHEKYKITKDKFKQIRLNKSGIEIAFVDGGISEIIMAPSISMHQLRIAIVSYKNLEKKKSVIKDFFLLCKIVKENDELYYTAKLFPTDNTKPQIYKTKIEDSSLKEGFSNGSISKFSSMILRFAELNFANEIIKDIEKKSILILDGSLQQKYNEENTIMKKLVEACVRNETLLIGFPKTTSVITEDGQDITFLLRGMKSDKPMWFFGPIINYKDESYNAKIFYAKLHKSSKKIFRVEISNEFSHIDYNKIFGEIATISADPIFLGYPYGLIKVDSLARVTNAEKAQLKTRFMNKVLLEDVESSLNSHNILDSIKF